MSAPDRIVAVDRASDAIERAAEEYIARGWQVVRVRPGGKKAYDDDWPIKNPQPREFQASDNIGVNLAKSGDLVDIDLDYSQARAMAEHFFDGAPSFGRDAQLPGHRLVRCEDAPPKVVQFRFTKKEEQELLQRLGLEKTMVLELRAGQQTVFPPSRYLEDGRWTDIVWTNGAMPADIPRVEWPTLRRKAGLLAFLSVMAAIYPERGGRDDFCLWLAGALVHVGVEPGEADEMIVAVARLAGDEEAETARRGKATRAAERMEAGENVCGLPTLVQNLGLEAIEPRLREWLQMPRTDELAEAAEEAQLVSLAPIPDDLPRRPWLVPNLLLNGHVSMLTGRGGEGKSLLALQLGIMIARGAKFAWWEPTASKKVLYLNAEDDLDEQRRRMSSACHAMKIDPNSLGDKLFTLQASGLVLIYRSPEDGKITTSPLYQRISQLIVEQNIGLVVIDPLVEAHAYLDENSNVDMKEVILALRTLARRHGISVLAVHHSRKGAGAGDQDSARGGSALVNACRIVVTMERMTDEEHKRINPAEAKERYVRLTGAKSNYAGRIADRWMEIEAVQLPNGDFSPGLAICEFGSLDQGFEIETWAERDAFLSLVREGVDGRPYSTASQGPKRTRLDAAVRERFRLDANQARQVIKEAEAAGIIVRCKRKGADRHPQEVWSVARRESAQQDIPF